jgi:hypothetical protein
LENINRSVAATMASVDAECLECWRDAERNIAIDKDTFLNARPVRDRPAPMTITASDTSDVAPGANTGASRAAKGRFGAHPNKSAWADAVDRRTLSVSGAQENVEWFSDHHSGPQGVPLFEYDYASGRPANWQAPECVAYQGKYAKTRFGRIAPFSQCSPFPQ